jgi:hypothetical protein
MRSVSDRICRENQNIYFMIVFFYEILWKNIAEPDMPQMTI